MIDCDISSSKHSLVELFHIQYLTICQLIDYLIGLLQQHIRKMNSVTGRLEAEDHKRDSLGPCNDHSSAFLC